MDFNYTDEQNMLRDMLARFVADTYEFEKRQKLIHSEPGWSRDNWNQLAEMGILGMTFPESYGGFGGGAVDTQLVMEELGKGLVVEPYLPSVVLAGTALVETGGAAAETLIPQIASGETIMSFAYAEPNGRFDLHHIETLALEKDSKWVLNGHKSIVLAAPDADKIIVVARTSGEVRDREGLSLFLMDKNADGLTVHPYQTVDGFRAGDLVLENAAATLLGKADIALPIIQKTIEAGILALAGEACGNFRKMTELTVEYCKTRKQFGIPIGKFQVLQHAMVDMAMNTEEMKSMALMAALKSESGERTKAVHMAKVQIGKSGKFIGENAIQLHGGMGITEEMAVGHYFMRSTMMDTLFGNRDHHLSAYQSVSLD